MKYILMMICLLPICLPSMAQVQHINGVVKSAENNDVLKGCTILLPNNKGYITDKAGRFSINLPQAVNEAKVIVSFAGYKTDTVTVNKEELTVYLQPLYNNLSEIVVSGTMKSVSRLESPIPVEVYSQNYFKKNPSPTIFESLNMINGVQPQLNCSVCNTGDIHINGLEGPYTMIMIDGMPIVSSLATVYGLHGIPQSIIKKVEVVKGPASTLYGSEAVAGLINIITKDPESASALSTDVMATSIGEFNADVATTLKAGKNLSTLIGVNYFNYGFKKDMNRDNFTDLTQQKRISVFNKWSLQRQKDRAASLALRYVYEDRWGGEMQWTPKFRGGDSIYGESIYTNRFELIGMYQLPVKPKIKLDYSYNYHHQDSYYGTTKYLASQHTAFAQMVWDGKLGGWSLLAGLPFRYIWYDDNSSATADTLLNNRPSITYLPGAFIQGEKSWSSLTVLGGLRYDYNSIHGSIVTPRISFKYSPGLRSTLRLTGGSGYRVVNLFTEDHAALTGARDVVIKEALKPEQSWNINANYNGWVRWNKAMVTLDGSLFYTYFSNQIVGDYMSDPQKIIYDNLEGYGISKGISANVELSYPSSLKILAGVTFMDVYRMEKEETKLLKKPQLFAPAFSGNYSVSYNIKKAGLTVDWTGKVNGPMYLPVVPNDFRPEQSPLHCIMNLQFTKKLAHSFEVYGGAKNLLNFIPKNPILRPFDPFDKTADDVATNPNGYTFDPTYNYAPIQGLKGFLGLRYTIN